MKKTSLKNLKLDASDLLKKEQLKTILGGSGGYGSGTGCCAYQSIIGAVVIDADRATAQAGAARSGGNWCCEGCADATWTQGYQGCA